MKILLYDRIYISLKELAPKDLFHLIKQYTRSNPKYYFFKKQHIPVYNVPRELTFYKKTDEYLILPVGTLSEIEKYFDFYDIKIEVIDKRVLGKKIDANFDPSVPLEDYQIEAFQAMLGSKYQNGLLQLPPGAGKTFLGLKYICEMKKNALIIVHEDRLVQQWLSEIEKRVSGKFTVGTFTGDGHNICDITIALIQSSSKHFEVYEQFKEFGIVMTDECLDPDTEIDIPEGKKRLGDIQIGDIVLTPTGNKAKVKSIKHSNHPTQKYTTITGKYLIASDKHIVPQSIPDYVVRNGKKVFLDNQYIAQAESLLSLRDGIPVKKFPFDSENYLDVLCEEKIVSREFLGERDLIDIELDDDDKLFIANGLIVHNCQHASSNTFVTLLDGLPAKYKFGISGTLKRKDRLDFIIPYYIGEKIIDIPDSRVKKRITDFEAEFVPTHCNIHVPRKELKTWQKNIDDDELAPVEHNLMYEYITGFKGAAFYKGKTPEEIIVIGNDGVSGKRNKLIVETVLRNIKDGHKPLVLTNRKMHAEYFLHALRAHGVEGVSFSSDDDEKSNTVAYSDLRKGLDERDGFDKIDFIVSTERITAEELDITDLSALHITIPSVNEHKLKQCAGRIRRVKKGKNFPIIYDYVDRELGSLNEANDYFVKKAKQRDKHYKEWKREYHA
jgi:superfamily II DNA or RNA helicase